VLRARISAGLALLAVAVLASVAQADRQSAPRISGLDVAPAKAPPARALAAATGPDRRYALANGCYALRSRSAGRYVAKGGGGYTASAATVGGAEHFRMQATALGKYLFYGAGRDLMAQAGGPLAGSGAVQPATDASPGADWQVDVAPGNAFKISLPSAGKALAVSGGQLALADPGAGGDSAIFTFEPAQGCAVYPEVETSASGKPFTSKTPWGEVKGIMDLHMHMMAFEFLGGEAHCGRPWHPYGAPYALRDCPDHEIGNGCAAALENVLYGNPARCHDPVGWPTFRDWPHRDSLTHEQTYYKWLERSYMAGMRVFVNLFVENRVLCEAYPLKHTNCNEMDSVRRENQRINELQDYIDAQNGGPGRGWFRLVRDPFEARKVIAQGKLAVIKGIEISEPFGCRIYNDQPLCDKAQIDRQLNEVYGLGVRQMELLNKFDNALAGIAGDNGETGAVVNSGNRLSTGKYWEMQACDGPKDEEDKQQIGVYKHDENDIGSNILEQFVPQGAAPVYPSNSNCNARGLSALGDHTIRRMIQKGMIIDPDHMSVLARKGTMNIAEGQRYSGVVSSHSWSTPDVEPRIYALGGVITPMKESSKGWIQHWRQTKAKAKPDKFYFGYGFGDDMNGLSSQPPPRTGPDQVQYPFKSFDGGVTFNRERGGQRIWDFTKDGVAHYGLFADWLEDIRRAGGAATVSDMARGAEAYLQMWERANGITYGCKSGREHFTRLGLGRLRLGYTTDRLLRRGGQPRVRGNRAWSWCALRKKNRNRKVVAALTRKGKVALVGSNAEGHRALRIRVGVKAKRLRGQARKLGKGIYVRKAGKRARFDYGVRKGRVSFVAVATRSATKSRKQLRGYLKLAGLR
jgi:hypothetical protein